MNHTTYIGLDVHKATVAAAVADDARRGEVRDLGIFANRASSGRCASRLYHRGSNLNFFLGCVHLIDLKVVSQFNFRKNETDVG